MSYGEAWDLVDELKRETSSHLMTDLMKFRWAVTWGEIEMHHLRDFYVNSHRDEKKQPKPIEFAAPWNDVGAEDPEPEITPEEHERLRDRLRSLSAFAE